MWVCKEHMKQALSQLDVPHIRKAPTGVTCAFCNEKAIVNMYYAHERLQLKRKRSLQQSS